MIFITLIMFTMCLAIPGKIIEISKDKFVIDYGSEKRKAFMSVVEDLRAGDYVIVNNKIIISRVDKEQAIKFLKIGDENGCKS